MGAACALADQGLRITLVERRSRLGGRAGSFHDRRTGQHLDHSQHVLLECCTNLLDLCERLGTRHLIEFSDELTFLDRDGRCSRLARSCWPAPFHMVPSFLRFRSLTVRQKCTVAHGLHGVLRAVAGPDAPARIQTMSEWLRHARQDEDTIDRFWRLFVVSTLNDQPERVDWRYGLQVFWESLLKNRHAYRLGVARVPLTELWHSCRTISPALTVRTRSPVCRLGVKGGRVTAVHLADGTTIQADHVVLAVPPYRVAALLPDRVRATDQRFRHLDRFRFNPIVAHHLWFDREVLDEAHVHVMAPHVQWVFNVSRYRPATAPTGQYLMAVISAPDDVGAGPDRQRALTLRELEQALPRVRAARLVRHRTIGVPRATFAPEPGVDAHRPPHVGHTANLFVAGDWTDTGWPATMEGAVRSGYACAEAVLRAEGQEHALVRPDLPAEGLARWWGR